MSDFLLNVFKGLYPIYFSLLILGVVQRISKRDWKGFDTFLLISFVFFEFLAAFQVSFFYGILTTSKRYLWIGLPLGIPFASEGFLGIAHFFATVKHQTAIAVSMSAIIVGINVFNVYSPVIHEYHSAKKTSARLLSIETATWIKNDWKGHHCPQITIFKCDQYQSGKRPLIQSELERVGWFCGGQNYPSFFSSHNIIPDYIVSGAPVTPANYTLVKEFVPVKIYKKTRP